MDIATIGGLILAVVSLVLGFTADGGAVTALIQGPAALIVFGGTIGAVMASVPLRQFLSSGKVLRHALFHKPLDPLDSIDQLVELATVARREGILALEERTSDVPDQLLKNGIQLVVDGVDPELVKNMLETELSYLEDRHQEAAHMFEMAGGFAPTMGIIGTVMGLVHVLSNLRNVGVLGPQIATAFTATLYGVASANVLWLPIANKLKRRSAEEVLLREIVVEGVLSIQAGENPNILRQKLQAFLPPAARIRKNGEKASETHAAQTY